MKQRITKVISIKRRINITDDLKDFIFTNINYRRKVYNDFVEESRKYENLKDFNPIKYKTTYYNEIEKPQLEKIDMYSIMNYIIDLIDDGFITKDEFIFQFKDILDKFNLHENI